MQADQLNIGSLTANYNNGKELKECLDSLVKQTHTPDIMVVVDDKSTDDSLEIINKLCDFQGVQGTPYPTRVGRYNNIPLFIIALPENKGPAGARNAGLNLLLGLKADVVCIADADDVYYPEKIAKSVDVMLKYPQVGLVYSDYDVENLATGEVKREFKEIYSFRRLFEECIVSNNSIIASKIFEFIGIYD